MSRIGNKTLFFKFFGPGLEGGVSLGHKQSITNTKSGKWCYNRCPVIYEVRRGTWWLKCIKCMERIMPRLRSTSPKFSLPSHQKGSERNCYLRRAYPCSEKVKHVHISSTNRSNMYTSIKNWKYIMGHLILIDKSTCMNITYQKMMTCWK